MRGTTRVSGKRGQCKVGDVVQCPGSSGAWCQGKNCCPGEPGEPNFPCPSAPRGWGHGSCQSVVKVSDCTSGQPPAQSAPEHLAPATSPEEQTSATITSPEPLAHGPSEKQAPTTSAESSAQSIPEESAKPSPQIPSVGPAPGMS